MAADIVDQLNACGSVNKDPGIIEPLDGLVVPRLRDHVFVGDVPCVKELTLF